MLERVLMVCAGNICRSPIAEGLLRARLAAAGRGAVSSAGLWALEGRPADPLAVEVTAERGVDISAHRARQITPEMVLGADIVLVMEEAQREEIEILSRAMRGRVHRIGKFGGFDVPDPYRQPRSAFVRARDLIERGLDDFERALWSVP